MYRAALPILVCLAVLVASLVLAEETGVEDEAFVLNGEATRGQQVFKTFCMLCHGENGDGNGPAAAALNPKPANYRDKDHMDTLSDQYLYRVVSEGGAAVGKSVLMPSWKTALDDQQVRDVVAYIRTFSQASE